ncbi:hypothetical protein SVIOM342S_02480 [Streptomyces violaceorubidus]
MGPPATGSHQRGGSSRRRTTPPGVRTSTAPCRDTATVARSATTRQPPSLSGSSTARGSGSGQRPANAYEGSGPAPSQPQNTAPFTATRTRSSERSNRTTPPPAPGSTSRIGPGTRARSAPRGGSPAASTRRLRHAARTVPTPAPCLRNRPSSSNAPGHDRPCCSPCHRPARTGAAFNCRSPVTGPHLHVADYVGRALVRKSITWHRPCQPRHAHTPARARRTHTTRTVREPPHVDREPRAALAAGCTTHRRGTHHPVPDLGRRAPRSPRRGRVRGPAPLVRRRPGSLLEGRHGVVRRRVSRPPTRACSATGPCRAPSGSPAPR